MTFKVKDGIVIAGSTFVDGSRNVTANTLTSSVATGTSPLTITSTTKVANLNAEMVDGAHTDTAYNSFGNSTIPLRNTNGYLYTNYLNMSADVTVTSPSHLAVATGSDGFLRWQTPVQFKTNISLNNVENTALSTWAGTANITTVGTIGTGTWNGTTIAVDNGGTGATTAASARTNLGLAIGSNVQAWDADLDAIAALAGTSGVLKKTAANTWMLDTSTYTNQTITLSGDATGSGATAITVTLANSGVTSGTYTNATITVDSKGRVTSATSNPVGGVQSVSGTAPIASTGGSTPVISLNAAYGDTINPYASKTANYVLAAPNGTAGVPTFRALVAADIPTLNQNTTGSAGSVANALTIGSYLTGTSYNGSSAVTIAVDATNTNTGNKVVARDVNGNFSAGTITAALSGNASTATTLQTARTINGVSFNGSANITIADSTKLPLSGGTMTGAITFAAGQTWPTFNQNTTGSAANISNTGTVTLATATESNSVYITAPSYTTDKPVKLLNFDWYGNIFSMGNIRSGASPSSGFGVYYTTGGVQTEIARFGTTGSFNTLGAITQNGSQVLTANNYNSYSPTLTGSGASGTWGISVSGSAATLTTGRTIGMTGDVTWTSATFNGSGNVTGTATLANSGVTAGTYGNATNIPQFTVDAKGRVTSVTNTAVSIPSGSLTFTGDVTGTGTTGASTALTLANSGVTAGTYTKITVDAKGRATSGTTLAATDIPALDASKITTGVFDAARLPSYVDDVLEYTNLASFPAAGETGKIYVDLTTNKTYRWSGSVYVYITSGAVDSVAGKTGVVTLVKGDVGLGSVDNTSDAVKNVLSATKLTTARTINGVSFDGSANITLTATATNALTIGTGLSGTSYNGSAAVTIALATGYGDTQNPYASKTANYFLAAPNGTAGAPTFRAIVAADIPTLNQNTTGSAATLTTARTLTIGSTGKTFDGSANVDWTLAEIGAYAATNPNGYTSNTGTVTSVGGTGTVSGLTLSGTVTTSGNLTLGGTLAVTPSNFASQTANTVLAAPNGTAGVPTFRAIVAADIPVLDASKITTGVFDAARLPSYVDDVLEYANLASFPVTGETGKIYVDLATNKTYRWSGTVYVYITSGAVDSVAGKTGIVTLVKADVGLGSVENTALSTWAGSANITTVGTIGTGTWNATTIGTTKGGTGLTSFNLNGAVYATSTSALTTGTLPIASGGTGATTAAAALTSLGAYAATNPSGYTTNTGTVTSVAALTIGTTGTDVSSTVATGTTTPVITLNIPTASATNRGALSSTDWTTFNNKTSNTGTVTSVGGTGTVSGLTLSGTVTSSGNLTLGGTLSVSIDNISDEHRLFNNMGVNHGTRNAFDAQGAIATVNFGNNFVQGNTNGPDTNSAAQYYSQFLGLGNDYGYNTYGMQIAYPRNVTNPYISIRYEEGGAFGAWNKISAGYADRAGSASTVTSITSSQVTTALGFTPYSSANPSGFITSSASITGNAATATNISGGVANQIHYQSAASTTAFIAAPTVASTSLTWNGTSFVWAAAAGGITIADDTTTNATRYIMFDDITSGSASTVNVSSTKLYFNPSTGVLSSTAFNSLSDITLKENIVPLTASIDEIEPVEFTWKDNGIKSFGVIAQQIEDIFPHLVETNSAGIKSVSYIQMIPILIKEILDLKNEVKLLKSK